MNEISVEHESPDSIYFLLGVKWKYSSDIIELSRIHWVINRLSPAKATMFSCWNNIIYLKKNLKGSWEL